MTWQASLTATDPYEILGIGPAADDATIRAAYRAGMKRFHPDQNAAPDAADKARQVASAYRLLSDPDQRARYDRQQAMREQVIAPPPPPTPRSAPRGRLGGLALVVLSAGIVGFALTRLNGPMPEAASAPSARPALAAPRADAEQQLADAVPPSAVIAGPGDNSAVRTASAPVSVAPSPPPPITLSIKAPDLTLPKTGRQPAPAFREHAPSPLPAPADIQGKPLPASAAQLAKPATDECETAATCARIDLAALDRMQTLLYNQSLANAPPAKQARLLSTRSSFIARLGRCASAVCKRDAYLDRNREIADLMRS